MSIENEKVISALQEAYKNGWADGHTVGRFGSLDNSLKSHDEAWESSNTKYHSEKIFKGSDEELT